MHYRTSDLKFEIHLGANRFENRGNEMSDKVVIVLKGDWTFGTDNSGVSQVEHIWSVSAAKKAEETSCRIRCKSILLDFIDAASCTRIR